MDSCSLQERCTVRVGDTCICMQHHHESYRSCLILKALPTRHDKTHVEARQ